MTLKAHIAACIEHDGPMRLDDYMTTCLLHPTMGYYTSRDPFGSSGDFITAPEISQMFGELVGLSLAQSWLDQGSPTPFMLAELGPGRGTLMSDALRACRAVPGFIEAAQIALVEASPALRDQQRSLLGAYYPTWLSDVSELRQQPLFLVANEFFDALPIRQFVRAGRLWHERHIGVVNGALAFGLGPALPQPTLAARLEDTDDGNMIETRPAATPIIAAIASRIADHGGAALIIDYGDWRSLGDTMQAVQDHTAADPLSDPGHADLTAHVDFEALATAAQACRHTRLTPQGVFLERLGITARATRLAAAMGDTALSPHVAAHRRLTHPSEMGNLFKVLGLYREGSAPPPGLEP